MSVFDPLADGDEIDPRNSVFTFSEKQLLIYRLLAYYNSGNLATIYRGAHQVLQSQITDCEALAAHGFREVIDRAGFWFGEEDSIDMKTHFNNELRTKHEKPLRNISPDYLSADPRILSSLASAFLSFCDWIDRDRPRRIEQASKALLGFQKRRTAPHTFEDDKTRWKTLYWDFSDIAHHRSDNRSGLILSLVKDLEDILLRYLRPNEPEKFNGIKSIVESTANPSGDTLEAIYQLFDQWAERIFFFECIKDSNWVSVLLQNGWFDIGEKYGPNLDSPNPLLPEVFLLEKFAEAAPDPVHKASLKLATKAAPFIQQKLLDVASKLPITLAADLIPYAKSWLKEKIQGRAHLPYQNFIAHLISSGLSREVMALITETLCFRSETTSAEEADADIQSDYDKILKKSNAAPLWDLHDYKELVTQITQKVRPIDVLSLFTLYCDLLSEAITLSSAVEDSEGRKWDDGSEIWMGSVEPSDQLRDYDHREYLVIGIRDLAEKCIREDASALIAIYQSLTSYKWLVFRRIAFHLLRQFPDTAGAMIGEPLLAGATYGAENSHEWLLLLQSQYENLNDVQKAVILDWIDRGPDLKWNIDYYRQTHEGNIPGEEIVQGWKRYWQYQLLFLLDGKLPEYWQTIFRALDSEFKGPGHATFKRYWSSGVQTVPHESPFTVESILTESNDGVLSEIKGWKQKNHWDERTEWGLHGALKSAALKQPEFFLKDIQKYRSLSDHERLSADRYLSVLQGCFEAGIAGTPLDWPALLTETVWAIREVILKLASPENRNLGIDIARGLEGAISKKEANFPSSAWDQLMGCIALLLQHPDPEKDGKDTESPGKLAMTSLNTTRLVALRALFDLDRVLHSEGVPQREDLKKRVLELLEVQLRTEPTLAGRGIYGEKMSMLLHFHRGWVEEHLGNLFPEGENRVTERNVVWGCFVTMQGASKIALEVLGKEYSRAIESISHEPRKKDSRQWDPGEGLVHHLAAYYWWGNFPLPDQAGTSGNLLDQFYKKGTVALRAHLLTFIGRSMRNTKEGVPDDIKERFQDLMEWRLRELEQSGITSDQLAELEGFWTWVDAQMLDAAWTVKTLQRVLTLHPFVGDGHDFMVIKPLAAYSANHPEVAMDCFYKIVFPKKDEEKETPYWWGLDEEIKTILRHGLGSTEGAKKQAEDVQDQLLRLGRFQFRNLDPKPGETGELG
jgi:hypothetical protein